MLQSRDLQAAAEHRWRLAMSFWEVHCVWRCFQRWRSWAALSAEDSSATYRRWLLLCSFKWWIAMVRHYRRWAVCLVCYCSPTWRVHGLASAMRNARGLLVLVYCTASFAPNLANVSIVNDVRKLSCLVLAS